MASVRQIAGCAAMLLALAACSGASLRDAYALSRIDPLTTRADLLRVAVAVPAGIRPRAGAITMVGSIHGAEDEPAVFALDLAPIAIGELPAGRGDALVVRGYRIAPQSLGAFETFRVAATAAKAAGHRGSLSVAHELCHSGASAPTPLPVEVYLKTAELDRFVTLTVQNDLTRDLSAAELAQLVPPCS